MIPFKRGQIISWWSGTFFAYLQLIFTKRHRIWYDPYPASGRRSHCSSVYDQDINGNWMELDITAKNRLSAIGNPKTIWIFEFIDVPQKIINEAMEEIKTEAINKAYAYLQLLYFPRRWFWERAPFRLYKFWSTKFHGGKDIRRWGNWFPQNWICSEETGHNYMMKICSRMIERGDIRFKYLKKRLEEWDGNNFHAWDAWIVLRDFKNIFKLIYQPEGEWK